MVTINCAALPEQCVESELFGHQKGPFTGATTESQAYYEVADGERYSSTNLENFP